MKNSTFIKEYQRLKEAFNLLKSELEINLFDNDTQTEAFVVVWNTNAAKNSPWGRFGKGGTRISPNLTLAEVSMLARIMTLKNAAAGLPLGGSKSGLKADVNDPNLEAKYRSFASMAKPFLRENGGTFGGFGFDVGGKPEHVGWVCDALGSRKSFTGKSVEWGGTDYDREGIAGLGVAHATKAALEFRDDKVSGKTFSVQGIGAMGSAVARYFSEMGATLNAFSDPKVGGTIRLGAQAGNTDLIKAISSWDTSFVLDFIKSHNLTVEPSEMILEIPSDIFFPSATQNVVDAENQKKLKCSMLVEAANNPLSSEARQLLHDRNVLVIPDFIANPGGIIAAFVEMTSEVSDEENIRTRSKVVEAKKLTEEKITANIRAMMKMTVEHSVDTIVAGEYLALQRIV